jgi:hypothetical protein
LLRSRKRDFGKMPKTQKKSRQPSTPGGLSVHFAFIVFVRRADDLDNHYLMKSAGYDPDRPWDKEEALFAEAKRDMTRLRAEDRGEVVDEIGDPDDEDRDRDREYEMGDETMDMDFDAEEHDQVDGEGEEGQDAVVEGRDAVEGGDEPAEGDIEAGDEGGEEGVEGEGGEPVEGETEGLFLPGGQSPENL